MDYRMEMEEVKGAIGRINALLSLEEDITMPLTTKPLPAKVRIVQIGAIKKSALDRVSVEDITHKEH